VSGVCLRKSRSVSFLLLIMKIIWDVEQFHGF